MPFENPPEPFSGEYYVADTENAVRGAVIHQGHSMAAMRIDSETAVKVRDTFPSYVDSIPLPSDPLYVLPKSRFAVGSLTPVGQVGNLIAAGFQTLCPNGTQIVTDIARMRIAVTIPGTLEFKVKFFKDEAGHHIVAVRRDSGDWFAFIQIYLAIKKFLREQGVHVEAIGF